ncbi:MAG: ABC transporter permease [Rhodothermales bacterium]|nr:ABC transporter permease [Rhodothermales bacterium]MBO6778525.1 ABC transporter permease [Rhodothermales bacterium]
MYTFDLDKAIRVWRDGLKANRSISRDDLDELAEHLRDHVQALMQEGVEPREAFRQAAARLGTSTEFESEFRKVRYGAHKRRTSLRREAAWKAVMIRNYLTIGVRNLSRQKFFSALNVGGLSIALASCLLIMLYVVDQRSYDRFHDHAEQIYRLNWDFSWNGRQGIGSGTPPPLAAAMVSQVPGVTGAVRVYPVSDMIVRRGDAFFTESRILAVDTTFFEVFSFPVVEGDPATALQAPQSVVLTETAARKYFGGSSPVGQMLTLGEDRTSFAGSYASDFQVTGVVADPPEKSHIQFDMVTSMASHPHVAYFDWSWIWMQVVTYVTIEETASLDVMSARLAELVAERAPAAFARVGFSYDELVDSGGYWDFVFQPLSDIYLGSAAIGNRIGPSGSRSTLNILTVVALFILLIACVNATNLSTARAASRAGEVGVRKALGSRRGELVTQFLVESAALSALAVLTALGLAAVLYGPFASIAGRAPDLGVLAGWQLLLVMLGMTALVTLLTGAYPALYLSGFRPIAVLKGRLNTGRSGQRLRNGLVVLQFALSITLIVCTLLVQQQMHLFQTADMGFDRDHLLVVSNENDRLGGRAESFRQAALQQASVTHASLTTSVPTYFAFQDYYKAEGHGEEQFELSSYMVDEAYLETLGLELVAGRGFEEGRPADSAAVILNEAAVALFGWDMPLGRSVHYPGVGDFDVIGVVRDFNFRTLQQPIRPFAFFHHRSASYSIPNSSVVVRLEAGNPAPALATLEELWATFAPATPFEYTFLDEAIASRYRSEARLAVLFRLFAGLAILIACLGLLGLAAYAAQRRTKEIGIRKTLGASEQSVLILLVRDFTRWVLVANVIAWPLAWYWADRWLEEFAFRIEIGLVPFLISGALAFAIAVLTVAWQASRAARANPVTALRYE